MLEAIHAMVGNQLAHVFVNAVVPPGHSHMETVIRDGFFGPVAPLVKGVHQLLLRRRNHEIDDAGSTAGEAGRGTGIKILAGDRAHKRQLHMGMRVDTAGHDVLAAGIDDLGAGGNVELLADLLDFTVGAINVGADALFGSYHCAAFNQNRHDYSSLRVSL